MDQNQGASSNPNRSQQLTQLWSIARSLNPVALTKLLRFASDLEMQSKSKTQARSSRLSKSVDDFWQIGN